MAIALPRHQKLFDGAVLLIDDERAIVVRAATERWLRLEPRSIGDAVELGYHVGNLHWRVRFGGEVLLVALEGRPEDYTARLENLIASRRVGVTVLDEEVTTLRRAEPTRPATARRILIITTSRSHAVDIAGDLAGRRSVSERRFAFSYGIEGVVALRRGLMARELEATGDRRSRQRWQTCDRIALVKAFRAAGDLAAIAAIDRNVEASTWSAAMRDGSRRNGGSFLASHARLGDVLALRLREAVRSGDCLGHIAVMQGAVWQAMGLSEMLAQLASAYGVASGVIAAAVRLGAIGALEGQKVLRGCLPLIETLVAQPVPDDAGTFELRSIS